MRPRCERCGDVHDDRRQDGRRRCQAHGRAGRQCGALATAGLDVCRMHGGASLRGMASPAYRHGGYSRLLPRRLRADYARAVADPELTSVRDELALVEARLLELVGRLDADELEGEGSAEGAADRREAEDRLWREIQRTQRHRLRLAGVEVRRLVQLEQMITPEQLLMLTHQLAAIIAEHVKDPDARRGIAAAIARLSGSETPAPGGPASRRRTIGAR